MSCTNENLGETGTVVYKKSFAANANDHWSAVLENDETDFPSFGVLGQRFSGGESSPTCEYSSVRLVNAESFEEAREAASKGEFTGVVHNVPGNYVAFEGSESPMNMFHHEAMDLASFALLARRRNIEKKAVPMFQKAFDLELKAVEIACEPENFHDLTFHVLSRSAATLAMDCGSPEEAKRLALRAMLEGDFGGHGEIRDELKEVFDSANEKLGDAKVYFGFLDWNNNGLLGEYTLVNVREITEKSVQSAAHELVERGYGYWRHPENGMDALPPEERMTPEEYAVNPAVDRWWIHAEHCPEGADRDEFQYGCVCGLPQKFAGEITVPYDAPPAFFRPIGED